VEPTPGSVLASIRGEIGLEAADQFLETLGVAEGKELVIDMAGVTFLDSTALAALLKIRALAADVRVVQPSPVVIRLLEITDLYNTFCSDGTDAAAP